LKILLILLFLLAAGGFLMAQKLSRLAPAPDWSRLSGYQQTITKEDFLWLLDHVYAPNGAWKEWVSVSDQAATVKTREGQPPFVLQFAPSRTSSAAIPRYWRGRNELPAPPAAKPLAGLRIAIDPGHIGGSFAKMEERWFQIGDSKPVTEGDMTLYVARLLVPKLEALGAKVYLTRSSGRPVTSDRPEKLKNQAAQSLRERGRNVHARSLQLESEQLFYRVSEIRRRAQLINEKVKPDLVLCLHFNAEAWGNPAKPSLVDVNHLHFLVTGAFSSEELSFEDQRYNLLKKLLDRAYYEEVAVTREVSKSMRSATGLPPFTYRGPNAVNIGNDPYIWGRNLLANRLFECPVVYLEPYVMNSHEVFARIQAGDYRGRRNFGGIQRKSIYREYADSLVDGLVNYYSKR